MEKITKEKYVSYYDGLADDLFGRCYSRLPDREKAKDILLETFTKGWTKLVESMYIEADIQGFLYTVADKLVAEQLDIMMAGQRPFACHCYVVKKDCSEASVGQA